MYRLIDRYVGLILLKFTAIVLLVLTSLHTVIQFLEELPDTGKGTYTATIALVYVVSLIPKAIYEYFPASCLIGALLGLGQLASLNELTIIRTVGISKLGVYISVIKTALALSVVLFLLGEFVAPQLEQFANTIRIENLSKGKIKRSNHGVWVKDKSHFIYISSYANNSVLQGVKIFSLDEDFRLTKVIQAKEAEIGDGYWSLRQVEQKTLSLKKLKSEFIPLVRWPTTVDHEELDIINVDPDQMTIVALTKYREFLANSEQNSIEYDLAYYRRMVMPLVICVMTLLALSFVFAQPRSGSMGARLVLGIVVGFSFYIVNRLFGPLSTVYSIPPLIASVTPVFLFFTLGILLLRRSA